MKQSTATIIGFVVSPLVPVVFMCSADPPKVGWLALYFLIASAIYLEALVYMLIVGVPAYFLFQKWKLFRWWSVALVGFATGFFAGYIYRLPQRSTPTGSGLVQGGACAVAGVVFWLIWRLGRTPKIASPPPL
jgi:hypothetical protein